MSFYRLILFLCRGVAEHCTPLNFIMLCFPGRNDSRKSKMLKIEAPLEEKKMNKSEK